MTRLGSYLSAMRPKTLWAAVVPVLMGWGMARADGVDHPLYAALALLAALCIQIGTNFANDYFDAKNGVDAEDRIGPQRATQSGALGQSEMRRAFILAFSLAVLLGVFLLIRGGWPILLIGLSSVALGVLYTGGPVPLAYIGAAELFAFAFFGPVALAGTYFVQSLSFSLPAVIAGFAPGFFSLALLSINNFRDLHSDRRAGKRSLVVRHGASLGRWLTRLSLLGAAAIPFVLIFCFQMPRTLVAPGILTAVFVIPLWKALSVEPSADHLFGEKMNKTLALVGRMELFFGLLFLAALGAT
jgi:1,4-dihydroxy-2-naphthoate polyprenyltransferase